MAPAPAANRRHSRRVSLIHSAPSRHRKSAVPPLTHLRASAATFQCRLVTNSGTGDLHGGLRLRFARACGGLPHDEIENRQQPLARGALVSLSYYAHLSTKARFRRRVIEGRGPWEQRYKLSGLSVQSGPAAATHFRRRIWSRSHACLTSAPMSFRSFREAKVFHTRWFC